MLASVGRTRPPVNGHLACGQACQHLSLAFWAETAYDPVQQRGALGQHRDLHMLKDMESHETCAV